MFGFEMHECCSYFVECLANEFQAESLRFQVELLSLRDSHHNGDRGRCWWTNSDSSSPYSSRNEPQYRSTKHQNVNSKSNFDVILEMPFLVNLHFISFQEFLKVYCSCKIKHENAHCLISQLFLRFWKKNKTQNKFECMTASWNRHETFWNFA